MNGYPRMLWRAALIVLLCAILAAGPVAAARVAADDDMASAFHATFHSTLADVFCPPGTPNLQTTGCATLSGRGHATHLGKATIMTSAAADFSNPNANCFPLTLLSTITTRRSGGDDEGDARARKGTIALISTGTLCFPSQTTSTVNAAFKVTGGTGRFAGATGHGTETALVSLTFGNPSDTNPTGVTGVLIDSFQGTLSFPHRDEGDSGD